MANGIRDTGGRVLAHLKEYWFLVALVLSGSSVVLYMVVYDVTPWDAHIETRNRRQQTEHHVAVGFDLLERGQYQRARAEFERALSLIVTNASAISGRYLSELFIDMESDEWNAAVGLSLERRLEERFADNNILQGRRHIVDKYLGDLHAGTWRVLEARQHYENALKGKKDYLDALDGYYSLVYADSEELALEDHERLEKLVELGKSMVAIDPNDYRGLHKLGYAFYEQAIAADEDNRSELLKQATEQSRRASALKGSDFYVVLDLGEIVRVEDPTLAVSYHKFAEAIVDRTQARSDVRPLTLVKKLLTDKTNQMSVYLSTPNQIKALVTFELALDYLAKYRQKGDKGDLDLHRKFLAAANRLDVDRDVVPIYEDGREVLDMLLPAKP